MSKPLKVKKVFAGDRIEQAAVRILRTRLKEFYSHWPDPLVSPTLEQLHNLRISGKRLRYSAEQLRDLYAGRLALLIDLLKRGQDLLGEIQDCVTQSAMLKAELSRLQRRKPTEAASLERLIAECDRRRRMLFAQFRNIWMGMATPEFGAGLKAMVSKVSPNNFDNEEGKTFSSNPISE